MNFLRKLFGDDDDGKKKPKRKNTPPPRRPPSRKQMEQQLADSKKAWDTKPLDELVQVIVGAPTNADWREAQLSGGIGAGMNAKQAWSALEAIRKRDVEAQTKFDALIPYINKAKPSNIPYQRALATVDESVAVQPLLEYAHTGQPDERLNALKALAEMKAGTAAEGLVNLIYDEDKAIRTEAIRALGYTGHPKAHDALKDYDREQYPVDYNTLDIAKRYANVPEQLENLRQRQARGDIGIDETLAKLEEQYTQYWEQ